MKKEPIEKWYELVAKNFSNTPREAIRFYNIETIPRILHTLNLNQDLCKTCQKQLQQLQNTLPQMAQYAQNDDPQIKAIQSQYQETIQHLKKEHHKYPKGLWLSRITTLSMIGAIVIALIISQLTTSMLTHEIILLGLTIGMTTGWTAGKIKEWQLNKKGQIF